MPVVESTLEDEKAKPQEGSEELVQASEELVQASEPAMATVMASAVTAEPPVPGAAAMEAEMNELEIEEEEVWHPGSSRIYCSAAPYPSVRIPVALS